MTEEERRRANAARNGPKMGPEWRAAVARNGLGDAPAPTPAPPANTPARVEPTGPVGSVRFFVSAGFQHAPAMACSTASCIRPYLTHDELLRLEQLAPEILQRLAAHADREAEQMQAWIANGRKRENARFPVPMYDIGAARQVLSNNPVRRPIPPPVVAASGQRHTPNTWGIDTPPAPALSPGQRLVQREERARAARDAEREEHRRKEARMAAIRASRPAPAKVAKRQCPDSYGIHAAEERKKNGR